MLDVTCSPWDVSIFATASSDRSARISTAESGKCLQFFPHPRPVTSVRFHPTEHMIATSCGDGVVRLFKVGSSHDDDTKDEHALFELKIGETAIGVEMNNDSLYTASWDGVLGVYDIRGEHISSISSVIGITDHITSLACDLYSPILASTSTDGSLRLFDIRTPTHTRIECINAHSEFVTPLL